METSPFVLISLLFASAFVCVVTLKAMNMSAVPAYFIAGLLAGPSGLGLLAAGEESDVAAEIGIILLLFTVGMQFNIGALNSIRRFVFLLGGLQVGVTALVVSFIAQFFVEDLLLASLIGFVAVMSPTAVISQILLHENSVNSPIGRRAVGILLCQDFLTIPLIIIYSTGDIGASMWPTLPLLAFKIVSVMVFVLIIGPPLMRIGIGWISRRGDPEFFVLTIVTIIILSALATGALGLSYVLGPFLAGILIAETPHQKRVEKIMEPFRHLFMGFFFMTMGLIIVPQQFIDNYQLILLLLVAMWALKVPITLFAARAIKTHRATAWQTALLLGGGGPFGFVLLTVAKESGILPDDLFQLLVPVITMALIATPFVWAQSERLTSLICRNDDKIAADKLSENIAKVGDMSDHIIICGFGRTGQTVAGILRKNEIPFVVLENNHTILESVGETERVLYGNGQSPKLLDAAGIKRATILNIAFSEPGAVTATVRVARKLNPDIHIIAKADSVQQAEELVAAGGDQALIESHQIGFSLAGQSLRRMQNLQENRVAEIFRRARYRDEKIFLSHFLGTETSDDQYSIGCTVARDNASVDELTAPTKIIVWRRDDKELDVDRADRTVRRGDELILLGDAPALSKAKKKVIAAPLSA